MKLLTIDTSTRMAGVGAWRDGKIIAERRAHVTTHSDSLLTMIDESLREAGFTPTDLDGIACVSGPGSFTGLRIGLATAKGLCFATGRPLLGIPTLAALAARAPDGRACAVLDAYRGEVYAALFDVSGGFPTLAGEEWALPPAELVQKLAGQTLVVVGDGALKYPDIVGSHRLLDDDGAPRPADVARLAAARLSRGDIDDLPSSGPHYIRASEAEIARAKSR